MERDAEVRVSLRRDDPLALELCDQRLRVGRRDADERAVLAVAARGGDGRSQLVEAREEPVREPAHVRLDRRDADLLDDSHPGEPRVDVRHRRRSRVEAPGVRGG